ncbi:Fe-S cluster assembly sulfur transfer protein SufU [Microbacterium sp. NIBRBAC000506063]|uniref:Fe-S cluster assembly sulfur transfer protein SufU n=1 Tax=Microbacterium sp. NIBRBAC000506063 TaxID=2734618 RepID=UPI001BB7D05A|nr:SUF system NifU family Fe-S cluster assembly protein [Microbacterium sp. NIBRBAC000506063]QTV78997.1 SUF system NifU family Fe-S cluster assembly protein [Microbacterium sp. NIBRBAC000506063]
MSLESLYQELLLDHSKRPVGKGLAEETPLSATSFQKNPICGDEVTLRARVDEQGRLAEVTWEGSGCSISQASASMLTALVRELAAENDGVVPRAEISSLIDGFREALRSRGKTPLEEEVFGDAAALSGVSRYSARVKCAMLAWVALEDDLGRLA